MAIEQRLAPRKVLRVKAMLVMDGAPPMAARTFDIATTGICLHADQSLKMGHQGQISFEMYFGGASHILTVRASVTYCIYSGDAFKVGFQFIDLGLGTLATISKYMR